LAFPTERGNGDPSDIGAALALVAEVPSQEIDPVSKVLEGDAKLVACLNTSSTMSSS
jgi:hypothetical protein